MPPARRSRPFRGGPGGPTPGGPADPDAAPAPDADPESVARGLVLRRLAAAPRSRGQLEADLAAREVPDDVAARVLDRFTEVGLVDDPAFAEMWVRTRHAGRGLSRRALGRELRDKGIADETAQAALDDIGPDEEAAAAAALVARRLAATRGLADEVRLRRLAGMLARKGYPGGLALRVVQDALAGEHHGATDPSAQRGATSLS